MIKGTGIRRLGTLFLILGLVFLYTGTVQAVRLPVPAANFALEAQTLKEGPRRTLPTQFRTNEILVRFAGQERFQRLPVPAGLSVEESIQRFNSRSDVIYAEPNYLARAFFVPNDQYYSFQWHLDNSVYGGIETEQAWDLANGTGVVVAVIDTGVAYENNGFFYQKAPDLAGTTFVAGYDFVNNDTHPNDDNGHGTHVTGTIAQTTNNSTGVAGVAFGAAIMPVKVLDSNGSGTYADVADGIRFAADNGAQVINLSLGGPVGSAALEDALSYAYNKGVTIVAAAGNDGAGSVSYPAAYDSYVIAVGATRYDETLSSYSNYGLGLDLVAPGGDLNVDQNGDGYGDGVLQQTIDRVPYRFAYYFYQGTSMATPHVVGAAALVISKGVASTPADVRNVLESTADDLGSAGRDNTYGWGLVNAFAALGGSVPPPPLPANQPPVANAGADQTLIDSGGDGSEVVTLDGSASSDPDGTIVSYEWKEGSTVLGASATISVSLALGEHTLTLTVTDDDGASASDTVQVSVQAVPPPPPPGPQTVFLDDFQSGALGSWTESNEPDWNVEKPAERNIPGYASSNLVAHADDCDTNCVLTLTTALDVSAYSNITLSFWRYVDAAIDRGEYLRVEVFNGSSWVVLAEWTHRSGDDDTWRQESADLTPYKSAALKVRFTSRESLASEEVELDDVMITVQ